MTNKVMKAICKALADAPKAAAERLIKELDGKDKEEAERIFKALKLIR